MITVVNYGAGNLPNVVRALRHVGAQVEVTDNPRTLERASSVVLPGVGATRDTMDSLHRLGLAEVLPAVIERRPFLGICVGMQVLCSQSEEFGTHACLDILPGVVRRLPDQVKVPQIGWNQVHLTEAVMNHPLFARIPDGSYFYFVHSYYCDVTNPDIIAGKTTYGLDFPSVIIRDHVIATQFHPEKSGRYGLTLLQNFVAFVNQSS